MRRIVILDAGFFCRSVIQTGYWDVKFSYSAFGRRRGRVLDQHKFCRTIGRNADISVAEARIEARKK
jgi:hypothetical protein